MSGNTPPRAIFRRWPVWTLAAALLVPLWIVRNWYISLGTLTAGDWLTIQPKMFDANFPLPSLWIGYEQFGAQIPLYYGFFFLETWMHEIGLGWNLIERILFFWWWPFALVLGMYVLALELTRSRLAAGVSAYLAVMNGVMLVVTIGGHTNATNSTALVPWIFYGALRYERSRGTRWLALVAFCIGAQSWYDLRWVVPTTGVLLMFLVVRALISRTRPILVSGLMVLASAFFGIVVSNAYWLAPKVFGYNVGVAPPSGNLDPSWAQNATLISPFDALVGWNPYVVNTFARPPLLFEHAPLLACSVLCFLAVSMFLNWRRPVAWYLLALYLCGAFLQKGANPPFPAFYPWAFIHIPLFAAYRDPSKFAFLSFLPAALLVGLGISGLSRAGRFAGNAAAALVLFLATLTLAPVFRTEVDGVLQVHEMPAGYAKVNDRIQRDATYGRVLWIPGTSRWSDASLLHPAVDGSIAGGTTFSFARYSRQDFLSFARAPLFGELLHWGAIRYIVVLRGIAEEEGASPEALDFLEPTIEALRARPGLHFEGDYNGILLFRVQGPEPHAWTTADATLVNGSKEALSSAAMFPQLLTDRSLAFADDVPNAGVPAFESLLDVDRVPGAAGQREGSDRRVFAGHYKSRERVTGVPALRLGFGSGETRMLATGPIAGSYDVKSAQGPASSGAPETMLLQRDLRPDRVVPIPGGELVEMRDDQSPVAILTEDGKNWLGSGVRLNGSDATILQNNLPARVRVTLLYRSRSPDVRIAVNGRSVALHSRADGFEEARFDVLPGGNEFQISPGTLENVSLRMTLVESMPGLGMKWTGVKTPSIPLWQHPRLAMTLAGSNDDPVTTLVSMHVRGTSNRVLLAIKKPESGALRSVRDALYQASLSEPGPLAPLLRNDALDSLVLDAIYVCFVKAGGVIPKAVGELYLDRDADYAASPKRLQTVRASSFVFKPAGVVASVPGGAIYRWPTGPEQVSIGSIAHQYVTVETGSGPKEGLVVSESPSLLQILGPDGALSAIPTANISTVAPRRCFTTEPSLCATSEIVLPEGVRSGVLALDAITDAPDASFQFATELRTARGPVWVMSRPVEASARERDTALHLRLNIDEQLAQIETDKSALLSRVIIVVKLPSGSSGLTVRISDLALYGSGRPTVSTAYSGEQPLDRPHLRVCEDSVITSSFGSGQVPYAISFSNGPAPSSRNDPLNLNALGAGTTFALNTADRWLVLSEQYDPLWTLSGQDSIAGKAVHVPMFGFANAWFSPNGFHGTYRLHYAPDSVSKVFFAVGLVLMVACLAWFVLGLFRENLIPETVKKQPDSQR